MITLITVKNPFKTDREIKQVSYVPGQTLLGYAAPETMGFEEYVVTHNGEIVEPEKYNEIIPGPEDYIAVCPVISGGDDVGKDIARAVALVAVTIASMGVGNLVAYGTWAGTAVGWGWGSYVAAAATAYAGGQLVNHLFPPPKQDHSTIPTWSNQPPITKEGGGIPVTFGTVKMGVMAPIQVLSQRITNEGTKSYLHLLMSGGEEVDEIRDFTVNKNPIENYPEAQIETRLGTNDQTVIPYFDDTYEEVSVGVELQDVREGSGDWVTVTTNSDAGSGLELTFLFPQGLCFRKDNGKLASEWVNVQVEYKKTGEETWHPWTSNITKDSYNVYDVSGNRFKIAGHYLPLREGMKIRLYSGAWVEAYITKIEELKEWDDDDNEIMYTLVTIDLGVSAAATKVEAEFIHISRKTNNPFAYTTRMPDPAIGQYSVRAAVAKEGIGDKHITTIIWSKLTHIIYDNFERPGKSLVALRALATDRLSGSLNVTWIQSRHNVWIWNPITEQYEQRPANNPAWAAYDIIYRIKRLKNINTGQYEFVVFSDVEPDYMDYQSFADWAAFCESKNLQFNGVIYELTDLWEALAPIEMAGRGKVVIRGTRYSVIFDAPTAPTGMYTVSNILKDSFKIEYIGKKDRANALEITFFNADNDYEETTVLCYGPGYDEASAVAKPTQIRLPYACSLEQAYREGKYQLRLNHYLNRAIYWKAGIDSLTGRAGEVVYVQHDVPEWGIGGRIAYVSENDVVLDKEVSMEPGKTYGLLVRLADDTLIEKALEPVDEVTATQTVRVAEPFEEGKAPETDDMFSFGPYEREAMPVRIVSIKRSGQLHAELMGLEYIPEIYEEAEEIPEIDYSVPAAVITDLRVNEYQDALNALWLGISWTPPKTGYGGARILINREQIDRVQSHQSSYEYAIDNAESGEELTITIEALNDLGMVIATASTLYTVQGAVDLPPAAPTGLAYNWDTQDLKVWWNAVVTNSNGLYTEDIKDYQIEVWVGGQKKRTEFVAGNLYTYSLPKNLQDNESPATTVQIRIYTRDYAEQPSAEATINCTCPLPTAPTLTAIDAVARISLSCSITNQQAQRYLKIQIKASQIKDFDPDNAGILIHDNPSPVYEHTVDTGSTWYYRARIIDKLGQASPWSVQVSATAQKVDESDMQPQILRMETTSEIEPVSGTLDNLHDGTPATGATFDQATWIEDKFVGEQIFSTFRINVKEPVDFYLRYFNEDTQGWNNCLGSASSPKTAAAGKNVFQISPFATARRIRVYLLNPAEIYEIRFGTIGQADEFYFEKMTGDQIEAKSIKIGEHLESAPIPLAIAPTDTLFRFDGSLLSTQGLKPIGME